MSESQPRATITCGNCKVPIIVDIPRNLTVSQVRDAVKSGKLSCPKCHQPMPDSSTLSKVSQD